MKYRILDYYDDLTDKYLSPLLKDAQLPEKDKSKLLDSDFALILRYPNGVINRHYPIHTEQDVKLSMDYFLKTASKLSPRERYVAAYYIAKAANAFGIEVPGYIETILTGEPFEVETNIVDVVEEPEEEAEEREYLLPNAKMLPVTPDNIKDYVKNFEKIAENLEQEQKEEAAFNLLRIMARDNKKVNLPSTIVKLAQAYSQRLIEKERQKKKLEVSAELKKLAASLPYEWHKLSPNQKYTIAKLLTKAASDDPTFTLGDVERTLIADYIDHGLNPKLLHYNLQTRADNLLTAYTTSSNYDPDVDIDVLKRKLVDIGKEALTLYKSGSYSDKDVIKLIEDLNEWDKHAGYAGRYSEFYLDDPYVTFSRHGYSSYLKGRISEPDRSTAIAKLASSREYPNAPDYSSIREAFFDQVGPSPVRRPVVIGISKVAARRADPLISILSEIFNILGF